MAEKGAMIAAMVAMAIAIVFMEPRDFQSYSPVEMDLANLKGHIPRFDEERLAQMPDPLAQLNTISNKSEQHHLSEEARRNLRRSHELLRRFFPKLFELSEVETVSDYSLLLSLPSTTQSSGARPRPALVMCHLDVAPVEEETVSLWGKNHNCSTCGPFSGEIYQGQVWGRGALDMKSYCVTMLHAAEMLLQRPEGWRRSRQLLFAIGHDEEVGGMLGQKKIVEHLRRKGGEFGELEFVLDEGNPTMKANPSSVNKRFNLALIGTAEKGIACVLIESNGTGGHASYPPSAGTSIARVARAVTRIQEHRARARHPLPVKQMLWTLSPHMPWPVGFLLKRTSFFRGTVALLSTVDEKLATMFRTTTAVTLAQGGFSSTALPKTASATINHRLVTGDEVEEVLELDRRLADDPKLKVRESRIYKYNPFIWTPEDLATIHGVDERVDSSALVLASQFFAHVFLAASLEQETAQSLLKGLDNGVR
ncbi:hypothetical protein GUITHDRAFT_112713 [Guillardia theta CCMP2712]|uniref:Peptidase M20 dimerisation domain-containing protein n=1 Tax=Guillardia theta (strain CCMP2712) TaxID=905079 RepID=L1IZJ3_GUITC|nr:hypothetical protein GUITHDRAFT_112713 [Guillardia theta CCMP2712]EKX41245.1 hypothetical protein GUITHDRAFT_112713 [Guillardia theta CCMP2712]|eukprot:XP_005828225.1 hypothetical protein GUITHDRAFT_112713 [Guillardia theta CCMP2712]